MCEKGAISVTRARGPMIVIKSWTTVEFGKIEKAVREEDWLTAVLVAAIQLERHGYLVLKDYLKSRNVHPKLIEQILQKTSLGQIVEHLSIIWRITYGEYDTIVKINNERNKLVHRRERVRYAYGKAAAEKIPPLIEQAIRILKQRLDAVRPFPTRRKVVDTPMGPFTIVTGEEGNQRD